MKTRSFPSTLEQLEPRIAPASVSIAGKTASWTDHDGDTVTLKWTSAAAPAFSKTDVGMGLRVDKITLNPAEHSQGAFTLSVKAAPTGDGRIDLGRIDATGTPLKAWRSPSATVAEFDAGNGTSSVGKLTIAALGTVPHTAFTAPGGDGVSSLSGAVSTVLIKGDIGASTLNISNAAGIAKSVVVQGDLRGDSAGATGSSGTLNFFGGSLGLLSVGGSVIGGDAGSDGLILTIAKIGLFQVKGSLIGGSASGAGNLTTVNPIAKMIIGGDIQGGSAASTGSLLALNVASFTLGGSILGGEAGGTGLVTLAAPGTVTVKGDIRGGIGTDATNGTPMGMLQIQGGAKSVTLGGDLVAGTFGTGTRVDNNGAIIVASGNVGTITVKGSIVGNEETDALILVRGMAPTTEGNYNAIGKLSVLGSVSYASIAAGHSIDIDANQQVGTAENPDAGIGSVRIGGNWFHSSLSAGINDVGTPGISTTDTRDAGEAGRSALLGPVIIKGFVFDNPSAGGVSGFAAEKIASITAGGVRVFTSGDPARSLDLAGFVDVVEI